MAGESVVRARSLVRKLGQPGWEGRAWLSALGGLSGMRDLISLGKYFDREIGSVFCEECTSPWFSLAAQWITWEELRKHHPLADLRRVQFHLLRESGEEEKALGPVPAGVSAPR